MQAAGFAYHADLNGNELDGIFPLPLVNENNARQAQLTGCQRLYEKMQVSIPPSERAADIVLAALKPSSQP